MGPALPLHSSYQSNIERWMDQVETSEIITVELK
jgi:hypothetical protein